MFLKIAAPPFEAGDFVNISKGFGVFEAHFFIKNFLIKKQHVFLSHGHISVALPGNI